jgi:hypothetical protein
MLVVMRLYGWSYEQVKFEDVGESDCDHLGRTPTAKMPLPFAPKARMTHGPARPIGGGGIMSAGHSCSRAATRGCRFSESVPAAAGNLG